MKAVILAGGLGTRMREETEFKPKPMVEIGGRPILWHLMRNLAAQGINEFIILVGYKGDHIKRYFLDYHAIESDFTVSSDPKASPRFHISETGPSWEVTVLDTGHLTLTGGRLKYAENFLNQEPFLLTYGDGLANVSVQEVLALHKRSNFELTLSCARPRSRFGAIKLTEAGKVLNFEEKPLTSDYVNIGFMIANPSFLDAIQGDEPIEEGPLKRLVHSGMVGAYKHDGFFAPMDTLRDVEFLNSLWDEGSAPWKNW